MLEILKSFTPSEERQKRNVLGSAHFFEKKIAESSLHTMRSQQKTSKICKKHFFYTKKPIKKAALRQPLKMSNVQ